MPRACSNTWIWVALLLSSAGMASAQQVAVEADYDPREMRTEGLDDEEARSRFRVAQTLYDEGRFLEAAREFESSYELSNRASLLFNAYLSYRDGGRLDDSVRVLDRYLAASPEVEDAERLTQRLAAMRVQLSEQRATQAEVEAEQERLRLERIRAQQDAEDQRQRADQAESQNLAGVVVGGAGLAMLVGALVTGLIARGRVSDIEDNCPDDRCIPEFDLESERDGANRVIRTTDVLLFVGAATTITGAVLLLVMGNDDDDDDRARVHLGCGPEGCRGDVRVGF